jgi:hypothetical protein
MTRLDLLKILIGQARTNGFDFRGWFTTSLRMPWQGQNEALAVVESHRRYYALLFNHTFAQAFWKAGEPITFQVPAQSFERTMPDGSIRIIQRKPFMRRSGRPDAWRYHLREMALAEEPLRYMRKYLRVEEELELEEDASSPIDIAAAAQSAPPQHSPALKTLALARKAAAKRQRAVDELPSVPVKRSAKRTPRLPGSR